MATAVQIPTSPRGYYLRPNELYVPVEEYLRTMYHPDMDYVDGHLEERNLGEWEHSELQSAMLTMFRNHGREWRIHAVAECRVQVKTDRFRIPDIIVIPRDRKPDRIVREAPLLCIEILSPEDTFTRILNRVDDYVAMGVQNVWMLDPKDGRVFTVIGDQRNWSDQRILTVPGTDIRIDLDAIAADLAD